MKNRITLIAALILISCAFAFGTDMVVNNGYDPGAMRTDGTNADSPVFPGAVTVSGIFKASDGAEFNGTASAVKILGSPAFPVTSTDGMGGLDVWNDSLILGADSGANTRTNSTIKYGYIGLPHYLNAEQPFDMLRGNSNSAANILYLGGGENITNAATVVSFWTGATTTTLKGTERARFNSIGQFLIATTTAAIDSDVKLKLNGGAELASNSFLMIGTDTQALNCGLTVASDTWFYGRNTLASTTTIGTSTAQAGYDLTVASGAYIANLVATGTLTIPLVAPADPQPGMIWFEP